MERDLQEKKRRGNRRLHLASVTWDVKWLMGYLMQVVMENWRRNER
jgi:hypothetical protein